MTNLKKEEVEDISILSPTQEGLFFHYLNNPDSKMYYEQVVLNFYGDICFDLFKNAWEFVISENVMLRTIFRWEKLSSPVQIILKNCSFLPCFIDYSLIGSDDEKQKLLEEQKISDLDKINLYCTPVNITLCKFHYENYKMVLSYHHILFDGWSLGIVIDELLNTYVCLLQGKQPLKRSKTKYKEFIRFCKDLDISRHNSYWTKFLEGFYTPTELPLAKRKEGNEFSSKILMKKLPDGITQSLYSLTKERCFTISTILYCAWGILLHRCNNSNDIIFGTTVSGRPESLNNINDIVGLFINTLPLMVKIDLSLSILQLLDTIDKTLQARREFENTPLVEIKNCSCLKNQQSLFKSIFIIENYPVDNILKKERIKNLKIELDTIHESTNYDLNVIILAFDKLEIYFLYNEAIYDSSDVEKLSNYYFNIISGMIENIDKNLSDIIMLSEKERDEILKKSQNMQREGVYDFD